MSAEGTNLRVGLEVNIFGTKQLQQVQTSLSALGLTIEDLEKATVNVHGKQRAFYKGVVELTGATQKLRNEQEQQIKDAVTLATKNAQVASSVAKTASAIKQATKALKDQNKQREIAIKLAEEQKKAEEHKARIDKIRQEVEASRVQMDAKREQIELDENRKKILEQVTRESEKNIENQKKAILQRIKLEEQEERQIANRIRRESSQRAAGDGGGNFAPMTAVGSVGRVIAYDMLRRTITNLYQGFWRIQETLGQWVVESISFNDEIERAKTVFQGIGLIGTKGAGGGNITIPEAELSTDPKVRAVLAQSQTNADNMMRGLMEISAMTGSDMDEVISSARQLLPDLINKRAKAGMPNPYLEKPEEFNAITQEMVKLASVLKMSDPGGRPLKWHMVAIQEMFSGTSGGGKDKGMEAVRSLRAREGVRVDEKQASELAKAVNSGDLMKASALITDILERAGQGIANLDNLMAKTLKPNIDGTITALRIFGMDFTDFFHKDLINIFTTIRVGLFKILNLAAYKKTMGEVGKLFADQFKDPVESVFRYLQAIYDDPAVILRTLEGPIRNIGAGLKAMRATLEGIALFIAGFLGTDLAFGSITKAAEVFKLSAYDTGVEAAKTTNSLISLISEIASLSAEINLIVSPLKIFNEVIASLLEIINVGLTFAYEKFPLGRMLGFKAGEGGVFGEFGKSIKQYLYDKTGYIDYSRAQEGIMPIGAATQQTLPAGRQPAGAVSPPTATLPFAPLMAYQNPPAYINPGPSPALYNRGALGLPQFPDRSPQRPTGPTFDRDAVIAGIKGMKPISFQPKDVGVTMSFQVGEMNVTTNDAKQFATDLASGAMNMTNKPLTGRNAPTKENNPFAGFSAGLGLNYVR